MKKRLIKTTIHSGIILALFYVWMMTTAAVMTSAGGWNDLNWLGSETIHRFPGVSGMMWACLDTPMFLPFQLGIWTVIILLEGRIIKDWNL